MTEHAVVHRYEVPVDDQAHTIMLPGYARVLHVDCRRRGVVEFWTEVIRSERAAEVYHDQPREYRVFGTGHPIPLTGWHYQGTALDGPLVWHLYERRP